MYSLVDPDSLVGNETRSAVLSRCVGALYIFGPAYALSVRSVGALC